MSTWMRRRGDEAFLRDTWMRRGSDERRFGDHVNREKDFQLLYV
jgi:hypothetical protein